MDFLQNITPNQKRWAIMAGTFLGLLAFALIFNMAGMSAFALITTVAAQTPIPAPSVLVNDGFTALNTQVPGWQNVIAAMVTMLILAFLIKKFVYGRG